MATAIVKDVYRGRKREVTLAAVQSIAVLAPLISPVVGGLILRFAPWRGAFVLQAILGLLVPVGALALQETITQKLPGNPLASLRRLGTVLKNGTFSILLINFALLGMASMAFISASSYIHQQTFGLSSQVYTYYYTIFSAGIALGPLFYIRLSRRFDRNNIVTGCFIAAGISGLLMLVAGPHGPWPFTLAIILGAVAFSCSRPPSTYLMLAQHETDAGSASGLILASNMAMRSIAISIVSLNIWGRVELVGALILGVAVVGIGIWLAFGRPRVAGQARAAESAAAELALAEGDIPV